MPPGPPTLCPEMPLCQPNSVMPPTLVRVTGSSRAGANVKVGALVPGLLWLADASIGPTLELVFLN